MSEKVITLPDREEMLKRLLGVSNNSHIRQNFYPILLCEAGKKLVAQGIVAMLVFAIQRYLEGMAPNIAEQIYKLVPAFIEALVSDPEVAMQAKELFQNLLSNVEMGI